MAKIDFKPSLMLNPVPVVLITSMDSQGRANVFTAAWTGNLCTKPPMVSVSIRPERLSYENIIGNKEFVINLPTAKLVKAVDYCGVKSGRSIDKISAFNFTLRQGTKVSVPSIEECPVNIECRVKDIIPLGSHDMFIAEVVCNSVSEDIIDSKGKILFNKADLLAYSHGEYYTLGKAPLGSFGYSVKKKKKK